MTGLPEDFFVKCETLSQNKTSCRILNTSAFPTSRGEKDLLQSFYRVYSLIVILPGIAHLVCSMKVRRN